MKYSQYTSQTPNSSEALDVIESLSTVWGQITECWDREVRFSQSGEGELGQCDSVEGPETHGTLCDNMEMEVNVATTDTGYALQS